MMTEQEVIRKLLHDFLDWLEHHPSVDPSGLSNDMVEEFLQEKA